MPNLEVAEADMEQLAGPVDHRERTGAQGQRLGHDLVGAEQDSRKSRVHVAAHPDRVSKQD